jgi:hypothetical protein
MTDILTRLAALTAKDQNGCLPCPFCTNAPEIHRYESHFASFGTSFQAECSHEDCPVEASSAASPNREEAIEDWNHNHSGSKVITLVREAAAEIERLRSSLHEGLTLCVRARKLDESITAQTCRELGSYHPDHVKCGTPHLWVLEQYDNDLAVWEQDARKTLTAREGEHRKPSE